MGVRAGIGMLLLLLSATSGVARGQVDARTRDVLLGRAERLRTLAAARRSRADSIAALKGWPVTGVADGTRFRLFAVEDGRPVYRGTHNTAAVRTIRAHRLRAGGGLGIDLHGDGLTVGLWDAAHVRSSHAELSGRIEPGDVVIDIGTHATHVAGTMAAAGVRPEARGVADRLRVRSFDWNDDAAEMAEAAAAGLTVSNHSYGTFAGWAFNLRGTGRWAWLGDPTRDARRDGRFGRYGVEARTWDEIAWLAPDYLIVKSAGNERADVGPGAGAPHDVIEGDAWVVSNAVREPDGGTDGWDSIVDSGIAKNVLTVGAVEDLVGPYAGPASVRMTTYSGFGPTDDGRIKPDLVAAGDEVLSGAGWADDAYAWSSGTSMAAPAVAAVAVLLRDLHRRVRGGVLSAAGTRALLVHTADEAGPAPGPDYRFGWGLVNAARAATLIDSEEAIILEDTFTSGFDIVVPVDVPPGTELRVTLAWTDPPGPVTDDPGPSLVHDLDLHVEGPEGVIHPWRLDPADPAAPATRAPNRVDAIEQVWLPQPIGGTYTIHVSSPDTGIMQVFALVVGSVEPPPASALALTGSVLLAGAGVSDIGIEVRGPVSRDGRTGPDGVFAFDDLPPGHYDLTPRAAGLEVDPATRSVDLSDHDASVTFELRAATRLADAQFFATPFLLQSGQAETAADMEAPPPGSPFAVDLSFDATDTAIAEGGRVVPDWSFDPLVVPYAGAVGARYLAPDRIPALATANDGRLHTRIPALWTAPGTTRPVRLPLRIEDRYGRLVGADTLVWTPAAQDRLPPVVLSEEPWFGRSSVEPGQTYLFTVGLIEPEAPASVRLVVMDRRAPQAVLYDLDMADDGDFDRHGDRIAGDRIYSALVHPEADAEYRLDVTAVDVSGNRIERPGFRYFSTRPFVRESGTLLLSRSGQDADTDRISALLDSLDVAHDTWEIDVRGHPEPASVADYDAVVWSWGEHGLSMDADRAVLRAVREAGTPMLLLGSSLLSGVDPAWSESTLESRSGSRIRRSGIVGSALDPAWRYVDWPVDPDALVGGYAPVGGTLPLAGSSGDAVVYRTADGSAVVSGVPPAALTGRLGLESLALLLATLLDDASLVVVPAAPVPLAPAEGLPLEAGRPVTVRWSGAPLAQYDIQVDTSAAFASPQVVRSMLADPEFTLDAPPPGDVLYWRARAVVPRGSGPWSDVSMLRSRENHTPTTGAAPPAVALRLGDPPITLEAASFFADADGDPLTWTVTSSDPAIVLVSSDGGQVTLTASGEGTAIVSIGATDPWGATAEVSFHVSVATNLAPMATRAVAAQATVLGAPAIAIALQDLFVDPDGDPITLSAESAGGVVRPEISGDTLRIVPLRAGSDQIGVTATDARGAAGRVEFDVTVRGNDAPIFSIGRDEPLSVLLTAGPVRIPLDGLATDPDGDAVVFEVEALAAGEASVAIEGAALVIEPYRVGTIPVRLTVRDAYGLSAALELELSVEADLALARTDSDLPRVFDVGRPWPNPTASVVRVPIDVPEPAEVHVAAFDIRGVRVASLLEGDVRPGRYVVSWDTSDLPAGVYMIRMQSAEFVRTRTVVRLR